MIETELRVTEVANADLEQGNLTKHVDNPGYSHAKPVFLEVPVSEAETSLGDTHEAATPGPRSSSHPFLRVGERVRCLEGDAGEIARVLVGPDGEVTHFVVRTSIWLRRYELLVPVEWIGGEDRFGIRLRVSRSDFRRQPEYRSDTALFADLLGL